MTPAQRLDVLQEMTGLHSFTDERACATCPSTSCPGKDMVAGGVDVTLVDSFPCFVKASLLLDFPGETGAVKQLLGENRVLRYVGTKTDAVHKSTTRRGSYGNLGLALVLLEDLVEQLDSDGSYETYQGMRYGPALDTLRSLPGCSKLQNHMFQGRWDTDFRRVVTGAEDPVLTRIPVPGSSQTTYKLNLVYMERGDFGMRQVAHTIAQALRLYFHLREHGSMQVPNNCAELVGNLPASIQDARDFVHELLRHDDARTFEVAAFGVLRAYYDTQAVVLDAGSGPVEVPLTLYRTGRVNANDGGIDYVLKPLGRIFQATDGFVLEKYFLDIEKIRSVPITFVIQQDMTPEEALARIEAEMPPDLDEASRARYLAGVEEVITLPTLDAWLDEMANLGEGPAAEAFALMLDEIARHYKVEYNLETDN